MCTNRPLMTRFLLGAGVGIALFTTQSQAQDFMGASPNTTGRSLHLSQGPGYGTYYPDVSQTRWVLNSVTNYRGNWFSRGYYPTTPTSYSPIFFTTINYPGIYGAYAYGASANAYSVAPIVSLATTNLPSNNPVGAPYVPLKEWTIGDQPANIAVYLPDDAILTFDGLDVAGTGPVRSFASPPLTPGCDYTYEVTARWSKEGREMTRSRRVHVRAGDKVEVDFMTTGDPRIRVQETQLRSWSSYRDRIRPLNNK